jgi:hypothetical protein
MDEQNITWRSSRRLYVALSTLAVLVAVAGFVAAALTVWLMYAGGQFQNYWGLAVIAAGLASALEILVCSALAFAIASFANQWRNPVPRDKHTDHK